MLFETAAGTRFAESQWVGFESIRWQRNKWATSQTNIRVNSHVLVKAKKADNAASTNFTFLPALDWLSNHCCYFLQKVFFYAHSPSCPKQLFHVLLLTYLKVQLHFKKDFSEATQRKRKSATKLKYIQCHINQKAGILIYVISDIHKMWDGRWPFGS